MSLVRDLGLISVSPRQTERGPGSPAGHPRWGGGSAGSWTQVRILFAELCVFFAIFAVFRMFLTAKAAKHSQSFGQLSNTCVYTHLQLKLNEENTMSTDEVLANQQTIIANQQTIIANQEQIRTNQDKLDAALSNQATIITNQ